MSLVTNVFKGIGILALAGGSLVGCKGDDLAVYVGEPFPEEVIPEVAPYFAGVPIRGDTSPTLLGGDFDNDGDLDFIVGASDANSQTWSARIYFFENDGKGNFTIKPSDSPINIDYKDLPSWKERH